MGRGGPTHVYSAAVRVGGKAFGHDDGAEERPQEVERPEGVAVVYEEDERVTVRRVERHRTDATAKLVFEKVGDAAQSRHLAGDAQHKALPGRPDRQSWVAHHPRRRAGRQRWSRHKGQSLDSSVHEKHHEQPAMSSRHQTNVKSLNSSRCLTSLNRSSAFLSGA